MKRKDENKILIIFLIVASVCFVVAFLVFNTNIWSNLTQPKSAPAQQPTTTATQTKPAPQNNGWQTYTSSDYGFSMNYLASDSAPTQAFNNTAVMFGTSGLSVQQLHTAMGNFTDSTLSNKNSQCLIGANNPSALPVFFYFKDIETINSLTAYHYVNYPNINQRFCTGQSPCFYYDIYRISHNGSCYEIVYVRQGEPVAIPNNITQMLGSFSFTQ